MIGHKKDKHCLKIIKKYFITVYMYVFIIHRIFLNYAKIKADRKFLLFEKIGL